jgi:hypothetical protein
MASYCGGLVVPLGVALVIAPGVVLVEGDVVGLEGFPMLGEDVLPGEHGFVGEMPPEVAPGPAWMLVCAP